MRNTKDLLADILIRLCEKRPLQNLSVTDILKEAQISRQTFYNHFQDKNDLIQYVYQSKVLSVWERPDAYNNYQKYCVEYFSRMMELKFFLTQACKMKDQNNLSDYIIEYANYWESRWFHSQAEEEIFPIENQLWIDYHCYGMMHLVISWILSGMKTSPEKMAELVTDFRDATLGKLPNYTK